MAISGPLKFVISLVAALAIASGADGAPHENLHLSPRAANNSLCLTPACIHAASELLYTLSPQYQSINPCTDFEELVCGGWKDRHDLRADQTRYGTFQVMAETGQMLLRHILEASSPPSNDTVDSENFTKLKGAYSACLDETSIRAAGAGPLIQILGQVVKSFPAGDGTNPNNLAATLRLLKGYSVEPFLSVYTEVDEKYTDKMAVYVAPSGLTLPGQERYLEDDLFSKFKATVSQVVPALVPGQSFSNATLSGISDFEKSLAAISPTRRQLLDITYYYNPIPLADAAASVPQADLTTLINGLKPSNVTVTNVIAMSPKYLKDLSALLSKTPSEVLQGFLLWKTIDAFGTYIQTDAIVPYTRFMNQLGGKDPDAKAERWRTCLAHVDDKNGLGWLLSRLFVQRAFSTRAKELGDRIISDIKSVFIDKLTGKTWMDESVIKAAINKVKKIEQKVGYPTTSPNVMDASALRQHYAPLTLSTAYFTNALALRRFQLNRSWAALAKPVDRGTWEMTASTVNAYYNPPKNEIVFPAGIMQFPMFDVDVPEYLTYGTFGAVAGHELSHAFDQDGRQYDEDGRYQDWWTNKTVAEFEKRAQCFVDQYNTFSVEGPDGKPLHVNGRLTLGENTADAGGLSASFIAWKKRVTQTPQADLPGLEYFNQEQLFFVSYATNWCSKIRKEAAINYIYSDPHAPTKARILYTVANQREFRRVFNCPVKEPTCELW